LRAKRSHRENRDPVTRVDGRPVASGSPGPLTERLRQLYWSKQEAGWHGTPIDYGPHARAAGRT
jgi:hypothetical protein